MTVTPDRGEEPSDEGSELPPAHTDVAALYTRYHGRMRRQALNVLGHDHPSQADEAVSIVVLRLVRHHHDGTLTEQPAWLPYLLRAVRNACVDLIRDDAASLARVAAVTEADAAANIRAPADPVGEVVTDRLHRADRARRAEDALSSLEPRLREIFWRKYHLEQTNRQIGVALGISGQRVGQLHDRAVQRLGEEVKEP